MSRRTLTGVFKIIGAFSTAIIASACSSATSESFEDSASQSEELGESFTSCVAADSTAWANGILTIDATTNSSGTIIVTPANSIVKVNGRTCKTAAGAQIALSAVKQINVNAKGGQSDTVVLDFSAGLPKAPLLVASGIVVDGGETTASTTTPDTVVVKGSTGVDPVSVGLDATNTGEGQVNIALTATSKVANVVLKKIGQTAAGPYQPQLIFSLGQGNDTFTALGGFPASGSATPMKYGMAVYGGTGDDVLTGGLGSDKLNGGGQLNDALDYSARSTAVFADMETAAVTVWGGDLRGVTMAGESIKIDKGAGSFTTVTFTTEATPSAIVSTINTALAGSVASIAGNRLRLTSTAAKIRIDSNGTDAVNKLGLAVGLYETVGNDGTPGGQMSLPWKAPAARADSTAYKVGDVIVPGTANGYWYKATAAGTSDASEPAGLAAATTIGGAGVTDGTVTWVNQGKVWVTATAYSAGDVVYDNAHNALYKVSGITGKSDSSVATLDTDVGDPTTDGGITWTTRGAEWTASQAYALNALVVPATAPAHYFKATAGGTSGATEPAAWPTVLGATVVDGGVTWTNMGPAVALAADTHYELGDYVFDAAGTLANMTASAMLSGASLPFPNTPGDIDDGDLLWKYVGDKAEADDVQGLPILSTGSGDDVLIGSNVTNTLNGNNGNDVFLGGPIAAPTVNCPVDKLNGGAGDDWFDMGTDDGANPVTQFDCTQVVAGSTGNDVVDYSRRTTNSALLVKLDGVLASGEQGTTPKEQDKIGADVEIFLGGKGADNITGTDNNDFIFGGPGADKLYGGKGDDSFYGGAGDDKLYGDIGNDTFFELTGYPKAGTWNEPIGGTWAGVGLAIYGSEKPGAGDDLAFGGPDVTGAETNKVDFTDAVNVVTVALCSDAAATNASMNNCVNTKTKYVENSVDGTTTSGSGTANTFVNIQYVAGSLTRANTFLGTSYAEVFEGGSGVDVILGQGGQDTLFGYPDPATGVGVDNTSADVLCGGDDDDTIFSGTASTAEGEGQMEQIFANYDTTSVKFGGAGAQAPSYCKHWASITNPNTTIPGVNLCFGNATTEQHCHN